MGLCNLLVNVSVAVRVSCSLRVCCQLHCEGLTVGLASSTPFGDEPGMSSRLTLARLSAVFSICVAHRANSIPCGQRLVLDLTTSEDMF